MKKLSFIGEKKDGQSFKVINAKLMKVELDELPKGRYKLTIEKQYKKASQKQFSYLYAVVYPMFLIAAWEAGYTTDDFKNVDELDLWCKARWANKPITNRDSGEIITVPLSKVEFKTIDELAYCDTLRNYASEYLGVYIPDPDPLWKENKQQQSNNF